jgi:Tfp pilus assembly protein FimT
MLRNHHGFTVVELCVVLMIAATLGLVSVPQFTGLLRAYRLNGAIQVVWGDLHHARLMAIKENRTIRVDFTATTYSLVRVDTAQVAFTRNLALQYPGVTLSVATNTMTFRSSGLLDHATRPVEVQNSAGLKTFTVLATGRIGNLS